MNKSDVTKLVDRFLGWSLPKDFAPDAGISFTPTKPYGGDEHGNSWWPVGTNLLTADQARQMFEYALDALEVNQSQSKVSMNPGFTPCGAKLIVYPLPVERTTASGIIIHDIQADREEMAQVEAVVVAIGPLCWLDQPDREAWCKVGDKIIIGKYRGLVRKGPDGKVYRTISDLDVVGVCTGEMS